MDANSGKKLYGSYEDAERVAKLMRFRYDEPFKPVKVDEGWVVGGVHLKSKTPYKRVKSLSAIHALFDDQDDLVSETDVSDYANQIATDFASEKVSEINGSGEDWILASSEVLPGSELGMRNSTPYLVLTLKNDKQSLLIKMGGEFRRHIPLVSAQAKSLLGRSIIWHTWNSSRQQTNWKRSEWFYLIEPADALLPD
jgi:hypothetical protein